MVKQKTKLAHTGRQSKWTHGLVNTPVMRGSTRLFDSYKELRTGVSTAFQTDDIFYGRMGTPSQWSLREAITELEAAHDTYLYPSGVAALTASLLALASNGDHILVTDSVYEPIRSVTKRILSRMGIEVSYFDPMVGADIAQLFQDNTKLVLAETPGSLTFEVQDIPAIAAVTLKHDAFLIVDNTWATPLFFNPLAHGADISINAGTKYLSGHSDVMIGSASANKRAWTALSTTSFSMGHTVGPDDAFLTLRGIRTLDARLRQHEKAALELANRLESHPAIHQVLHPALSECPGHNHWRRDFTGSTGLFSIVLKQGIESDVAPMVDHMNLFKMGFSWGGFESLILPADPTQIRSAIPWKAPGPLLRLHIGLEDLEDLWGDLEAGLERYMQHMGLTS